LNEKNDAKPIRTGLIRKLDRRDPFAWASAFEMYFLPVYPRCNLFIMIISNISSSNWLNMFLFVESLQRIELFIHFFDSKSSQYDMIEYF
jgi:hypothetical protein